MSFFNKKSVLLYLCRTLPSVSRMNPVSIVIVLLCCCDAVLVVYSTLSLTVDNWRNIFWCPRVFSFNLFLALYLLTSALANIVPSSIM